MTVQTSVSTKKIGKFVRGLAEPVIASVLKRQVWFGVQEGDSSFALLSQAGFPVDYAKAFSIEEEVFLGEISMNDPG